MLSGISTSLANLLMEIYAIGNLKKKKKIYAQKNMNPDAPTSNRRISP